MVDLTSPRASRLALPRWLDARFAAGVLLVLLAVVGGARVIGAADDYDRVWVARHPLAVGQQVTADDFSVGRARLYGSGEHYLSADAALPVGYVVVRAVGAGEMVPLGAVSATGVPTDRRLVSVPVAPGHFPADLARGDVVDVYVTAKSHGGAASAEPPQLVLSDATVSDRDGGARGFAAGSSVVGVVLSVPAGDVTELVGAVEAGSLDVVRVPAAVAASHPPVSVADASVEAQQ